MQVRRRAKFSRSANGARPVAISMFSVTLLVFAFVYPAISIFVSVTSIDCEAAYFWTYDWAGGVSPLQLIGYAIAAFAIIWVLRFRAHWRQRKIETLFQLMLICGLAGALLAQLAYLFPFAPPTRAQYDRVMAVVSPMPARLDEEWTEFRQFDAENWRFDYPPPPFPEEPVRPSQRPEFSMRMEDLFPGEHSPTYGELKDVERCVAGYRAALVQYEEDLAKWDAYLDGFYEWYAAHGPADE